MRYLTIAGLLLLAQLSSLPALAAVDTPAKASAKLQPADIKEAHKAAAKQLLDVLNSGVVLKGTEVQNGSDGQFEAFFYQGSSLIREIFGQIQNQFYRGSEGAWASTNFSLPFQVDPADSPADTVLNLLSDGTYLTDPYWAQFTYVGEVASGYSFKFTPAGLPPVDVILNSDEDDPGYLQILSTEVSLDPTNPHASHSRSFYYFAKDAQGRLYNSRETAKQVDAKGEEIDFSDYTITSFEVAGKKPDGLKFDTARTPVGNMGAKVTAPVKVDAITDFGYYIVPVTFANGTTLNFILDTGSNVSLFTPAAVAASELETSMRSTAHGHGTRLSSEVGTVSGASLGTKGNLAPLAPFPTTKIEESSKDVLRAMDTYHAAGILGLAPLEQYIVTLDPVLKSVTLTPQQLFDPAKSLAGPYLTYTLDVEDLIYTNVRINDKVVGQMALDTGLQQDLALISPTMDADGLTFTKVGTNQDVVVGGAVTYDFVTVPSIDLGPLRLENKIAPLEDDDFGKSSARKMLGLLGLSLFTQAKVTFDLFSQRMYVQPPAQLAQEMQQHAPALFEGLADEKYQAPAAGSGAPVPFGGPGSKPATPPASTDTPPTAPEPDATPDNPPAAPTESGEAIKAA